ncbi:DNA-binding response regulator [Prolixibacter bellariivorans]|uniref:DNA-binding response regulator n=1 Tax=Prolixibacter bellariivorans TaxID=314319 RepID=A0A5M4B0P4_9BACT|nr:LytTR family DNA-binding domain-containing protein [Prolixibacter bellariivorans]GET33732.1 DNA-binding response regulator [Prolixibacter bellariivorans]
MNVLLVEDEKPAAQKMTRLLKQTAPDADLVAITETVEETVNWLQERGEPDLILMDIHLDDGLCFEIFDTVKVTAPVIFTTAYDEYAIRAFKVNSIDYLLKPVNQKDLEKALSKYRAIHEKHNHGQAEYQHLLQEFSPAYKSRFLLKIGNRYKSVSVNQIKYIFSREGNVFLQSIDGQAFALEFSLDHVQKLLDPSEFFRINRNCLIHINSVEEMIAYSSSRLQLRITDEKPQEMFVVSRDRVPEFKRWMDR